MTFLRGAVKMDIPDYIVSEVDDRLSDGATPQTSQDATTAAAQTVAQYSSEYEILTESEIEEKYQADPDNADIAIEMSEWPCHSINIINLMCIKTKDKLVCLQLACWALRAARRPQPPPRRCSRIQVPRRQVPQPPSPWRLWKRTAKPAARMVSSLKMSQD